MRLGGEGPGGHDGRVRGRQGRADGVGQGEGGRVCVTEGGGGAPEGGGVGQGRAGMTAVFKGVRAAPTAWDRRRGGGGVPLGGAGPGEHDGCVRGRQGRANGEGQKEGGFASIVEDRGCVPGPGLVCNMALFKGVRTPPMV